MPQFKFKSTYPKYFTEEDIRADREADKGPFVQKQGHLMSVANWEKLSPAHQDAALRPFPWFGSEKDKEEALEKWDYYPTMTEKPNV